MLIFIVVQVEWLCMQNNYHNRPTTALIGQWQGTDMPWLGRSIYGSPATWFLMGMSGRPHYNFINH